VDTPVHQFKAIICITLVTLVCIGTSAVSYGIPQAATSLPQLPAAKRQVPAISVSYPVSLFTVFLSGVVGSTLAFDVTADVLRAMVDARSNLGWLIKLDEETGTQRVISYDSGTIPGANPQISKPPC
jgi:hypothetical protein